MYQGVNPTICEFCGHRMGNGIAPNRHCIPRHSIKFVEEKDKHQYENSEEPCPWVNNRCRD
ncbi:uncharacterized protein LY89DRAFT_186231 [Mollisia scopiformis]|uniref:C2H2-type domain-containing protein n=1 Tax=Mollisia scopiformis TaxID=149040 RepID=A0A194XTP6_MOLSC|nr:uncharacterized protein LY89DRAFT_186231 [Mollisia scopiformis]KUJ23583.1 hypothetical protein LY89DRAFT_186231 [Mollisia scopiformis]